MTGTYSKVTNSTFPALTSTYLVSFGGIAVQCWEQLTGALHLHALQATDTALTNTEYYLTAAYTAAYTAAHTAAAEDMNAAAALAEKSEAADNIEAATTAAVAQATMHSSR
jgi:hypothetical protein